MRSGAGRYAPSPSGDLHLGNLRTALLAWAHARHGNHAFYLRIDDLDRVAPGAAERQLADLAALGIDWDAAPLRQSSRSAHYLEAVGRLDVYECYCSRKDIQAAPTAPHAPPGAYPGTCRNLSESAREAGRARLAEQGRRPATRLRAEESSWSVQDSLAGEVTGAIDDFVLLRGDGTPAYNLASVVDDASMGVTHVVRGDDLLASSPRQAYVAGLLGAQAPTFMHVPLVLGPEGARLAKRDGAVTLERLRARGWTSGDALAAIGASLGAGPTRTAADFLAAYPDMNLRSGPWTFDPPCEN